jgi:hypothetical protein
MRSLAEIVNANREAAALGVKSPFNPVGVAPKAEGPVLTPERLRQLGLDKY